MSFISFEFAVLFAVTITAYMLSGERLKRYILLLSSLVFIGFHNILFLGIALAVTMLSYISGLLISGFREKGYAKCIYAVSVILLVACWVFFRYAGSWGCVSSFVFPLGMSFYTFQAISYITEVYWEETEAERSVADYALYMLFFMKFLSGPIERPENLLPQIKRLRAADYGMMVYGAKLVAVGIIKKVVLADHLSPYVSSVFDSVHTASGAQLLMAALLYPIELYADFSGYTDMALGGAMMLGFQLTPNFNRPFASYTITDFWRRWHISLSSWVRDYVYMPLTAATRALGEKGIVFSLVVTFVLLGVWHGVGMTFVIYGLIQGLVIVYEMKSEPWRRKIRQRVGKTFFAFYSIVRTYLLFAFSLVFFRSATVSDAFYFLRNISFRTDGEWTEINLGMSDHVCIVAGCAFVLIMLFEYLMSKKDLFRSLEKQKTWVRWIIYFLTVFAIFAFGKFSSDEFIYLQF